MLILWKVGYLDRTDKRRKDRFLALDTNSLDVATAAAVELMAENHSVRTAREALRYRSLFVEKP